MHVGDSQRIKHIQKYIHTETHTHRENILRTKIMKNLGKNKEKRYIKEEK